jgi:hypothetical protein
MYDLPKEDIYRKLRAIMDGETNLFVSPHSGQVIFDPFYDETLRFEVDPIEYYGLSLILSVIRKGGSICNDIYGV